MKAGTRLAVILSGLSASLSAHAVYAQILLPVPEVKKTPTELLSARFKALTPAGTREIVTGLIAKLDDPSLTVRQEAEKNLSGIAISQAHLEESILDPKTSPEQRLRLIRLGAGVLYRTPRAAVGIRFSMKQLEVGQLIEGFDAMRVLQVGDEILSVAGHPMNSHEDLRPAIVMHSPGAEVTMRVMRQGRPLTLRLRLGNFDALPSLGFRDDVSYEDCVRAWNLRAADLRVIRNAAAKSGVVEVGLDAAAWDRLRRVPSDLKPDPTTMPWGDVTLTVGGAPRDAGGFQLGVRPTLTTHWDRVLGGAGRDGAGRGGAIIRDGIPQQHMQRLEDFQKFMELQRKLTDDTLDEAAKAKLLAEVQELTNRAFDLDASAPGRRKP